MKLIEAIESGKRFRLPGHRWMRIRDESPEIVIYSDEDKDKFGNPEIHVDYLKSDDWEIDHSKCEKCDTGIIDACLNCGAPRCCPKCCVDDDCVNY